MGVDITKLCMIIAFGCILCVQDYYCTQMASHSKPTIIRHIVPVKLEQQNKIEQVVRATKLDIVANVTESETQTKQDIQVLHNVVEENSNATKHSNALLSEPEKKFTNISTPAIQFGSIHTTNNSTRDRSIESVDSQDLPHATHSSNTSTHEISYGSISSSNLSAHWERLAMEVQRNISVKVFMEFDTPHFGGGANIIKHYLVNHGWKEVEPKSVFAMPNLKLLRNKAKMLSSRAQTTVKDAAYFILSSCYYPGAQMLHNITEHLPNSVIHTSLKELGNTNKKKFIVAMKNYYTEQRCEYTNHIPETYLIKGKQSCQDVLDQMDDSDTSRWYTKSAKESFGRGIQIRTGDNLKAEMNRCTQGRIPGYYMAQKEVANALLVNGRSIYSRHYLVFVGHGPNEYTAYFIEGYVLQAKDTADGIVAIGEAKNGGKPNFKPAIANSPNNGDAKYRFAHKHLQDDFIKEGVYTKQELLLLKKRMKMSAQDIAEAYSNVLNFRKGSFSIFGLDMVFDDSMHVYNLETNCNCGLFNDLSQYGEMRVGLNRKMLKQTLDVVFASKFATKAFMDTMKEELVSKKFDISNEGLSTDTIERKTMLEPISVKLRDMDWRYGELTGEFC